MGLEKYFNYYRATFKGEVQEKLKRKLEIKLGILKKKSLNKQIIKVEINENFFDSLIEEDLKLDNVIEKEFYIFNKKLDLEQEFLDDNRNSKEWYLENIKNYKDISK